MENQTKVGMNRTGMQMAPQEGAAQVEYANKQPPHPGDGSELDLAVVRGDYIAEALRVGSVAVPAFPDADGSHRRDGRRPHIANPLC